MTASSNCSSNATCLIWKPWIFLSSGQIRNIHWSVCKMYTTHCILGWTYHDWIYTVLQVYSEIRIKNISSLQMHHPIQMKPADSEKNNGKDLQLYNLVTQDFLKNWITLFWTIDIVKWLLLLSQATICSWESLWPDHIIHSELLSFNFVFYRIVFTI